MWNNILKLMFFWINNIKIKKLFGIIFTELKYLGINNLKKKIFEKILKELIFLGINNLKRHIWNDI